MITSNLRTEEVKITEEDCPVCRNADRFITWKSVFDYCDKDNNEEQTDFNDESYFMCSECGYMYRRRKGGESGIFSDYEVEGISIKESNAGEYGPDVYTQIENLSTYRHRLVDFNILDHKEYEPDFCKCNILDEEEEE